MLNLMKLESRIVLDGAIVAAALGHEADHESAIAETQFFPESAAAPYFNEAIAEAAALIADPGEIEHGLHIVLISDQAPDYQQLVEAVNPEAHVIVYNASTESAADLINQVELIAAQANMPIDSISILSHGGNGYFNLGNDLVTDQNLTYTYESWIKLNSLMSDEGHIYLFGCNVAGGEDEGQKLLDSLAQITGAQVYASDNVTGAEGDWMLEAVSYGAVASSTPNPPLDLDKLADSYTGTLAPPVFERDTKLPIAVVIWERADAATGTTPDIILRSMETGISFSVIDRDNPSSSQNLIITAISSDQTILPNSNITFEHQQDNNWIMKIEPNPYESTQNDIYVTITAQNSAGEQTTDAVRLNIQYVNDKPSFNVVHQEVNGLHGTPVTIPLNQWTSNINLGALENPGEKYAQNIKEFTFKHISGDPNILIGNPQTDSAHNLILNPNAAYGINGTATYEVTIYDDGGTQRHFLGGDPNNPNNFVQIGFDSNTATTFLTITVNFNQPPKAFDENANACEGFNVTGQLLRDYDPEGDPFVYMLSSNPVGRNGVLTLNPNGSFVYTPNDPNYYTPAGQVADTFTFYVQETNTLNRQMSNTATLTLVIDPANDPPTFKPGPNQQVLEDSGAHRVPGWAKDMSPGPPNESHQVLDFRVTNDNPSLFSVAPSINAVTGDLTYTLAENAFGVANVTVVLWDDGGYDDCNGIPYSDPEKFTITVLPVNDPPEFVGGGNLVICEDPEPREQVVPNWAQNIIPGPPNESNQTVQFIVTTDRPDLFVPGSLRIDPDGTLRYAPAQDANGLATVTVVLKDSGGTEHGGIDQSQPYTFTINILPVNDMPTFSTQWENRTVTIITKGGEYSIDGWADNISPGPPNESHQTVWFEIENDNPDLFEVQPHIDPETGNLYYTVKEDVEGTANLRIVLKDNGGTTYTYTDEYGNIIVCGGVDTSEEVNFIIEIKAPPGPQPEPDTPHHPKYDPDEPYLPPGPGPIKRPEGVYVDGDLDGGMSLPGQVGPFGERHDFPPFMRTMRGPAADAPLVDVCTLEEVLQKHLGCRFAPGIDVESRFSQVRWPDFEAERPVLDDERDMFSKLFMRHHNDPGFNHDAPESVPNKGFQVELGQLEEVRAGFLKAKVFAVQPGVENFNDMKPGDLKQVFFENKDQFLDRTMRWCVDQGEPLPWEDCRANMPR